MKKLLVSGLILLLPLLFIGCASSGPKQEEVDRLSIIEAQLARIVAELSDLHQQIEQNGTADAELRTEIQNSLNELKGESARYDTKVETILAKIEALSERMDDSELRISNLRREINSLRFSRTGSPYAQPITPDSETYGEPGNETGEPTGEETALPTNEAQAFQMAHSDFLQGEYALSVSGFRGYLRSYPEGTRLEDARFYLAESVFSLGDYEGAVEEYNIFIRDFPESPRIVTATYKKGLAFLNSSQTAQGVILLQQLIRRYPDTNEARLARDKLKSLGLNP